MTNVTVATDASGSVLALSSSVYHRRHRHRGSDRYKGEYSHSDPTNHAWYDMSGHLPGHPTKDSSTVLYNTDYPEFVNDTFSEVPEMPFPAGATTTISSKAKVSGTNHSLTFQKDFQSNSTINTKDIISDFKPSYYNHYDISSSSDESANAASEFQQNEFIPLNTDDKSRIPHFDAEFFPEPLSPLHAGKNWTESSLSEISFDHFRLSLDDSDDIHHPFLVNNSQSHADHNQFFNFTNFLLNQSGVVTDFGYAAPTINYSTDPGTSNNESSSSSDGVSSADIYTWSILIMAPFVVFGVGGNTLVILAISLEKRLQNVTNYFLLSLAVTDLLVSIIVMPFSIINVLTGRWLFGLLLCDFFVTSDVLMCTSSILHLCTISLERYIGIRYPLWTKNKSKRIVLLKIVLVWTIALAISSPITILGVVKEDNVLHEGACVLSNEYFIIYGSIFAFYIPLAIMVLMYALTVRMLNKQARLCNSRPATDNGETQPMIRRSTSRRNWQGRRQFYDREAMSAALCSGAHLTDGVMAPFHQRYRSLGVSRHNTVPMTYHGQRYLSDSVGDGAGSGNSNSINNIQRTGSSKSASVVINNNNNSSNYLADSGNNTSLNSSNGRRNRYLCQNGTDKTLYMGLTQNVDFSYCNGHQDDAVTNIPSESQNCFISSSSSPPPSSKSAANHEPKRFRDLVRKHHMAVKAANILLMKREGQIQGQSSGLPSSTSASVRRDNSVRTEQKASKVLGVVFMIFVICWAPFFTVNILTALCTSCKFEPTLITAFVWLGYISSTLNPIIYTIFNNIFRITFIKLLRCRYRLLHRAKRSTNMLGIRNGLLNCTTLCPVPLTSSMAVNSTSVTLVEESRC